MKSVNFFRLLNTCRFIFSFLMEVEFRAVIHYCYLRDLTPLEIFLEMKAAYQEATPAMKTIYKWYDPLAQGRKTLDDDPRSGRPVNIENGLQILNLLVEQPFVTARYIADSSKFWLKKYFIQFKRFFG